MNDQGETGKLAAEFKEHVLPGKLIAVNGNLGSGKTYFISKALIEFGIDYVTSPTFAIVNEYQGSIKAYHFDFFRLKSFQELMNIGWQDYLNDINSVIFVEWAELLPEALPKNRIEISITMLEDTRREFEFNYYE